MFENMLQCLEETALHTTGLELSILCTKFLTPGTVISAASNTTHGGTYPS